MNPRPWLTGIPLENPAIRLFLFPHAGGSASAYGSWLDAGPRDIEIRAVQYPGRESRLREEPPRSITGLAGPLAAAVAAEPAGPPCVFFGHSMGSLVAFEVARTLREQGFPGPRQMFAAACAAPGGSRRQDVSLLPDEGLLDWARSHDEASAQALAHPELAALSLPALRADLTAVETYRAAPGPLLDCPITVLTGKEDSLHGTDITGWRDCTSSVFEHHEFSGGHFFVRSPENNVLAFLTDRLVSRSPEK